jgi:hypothetical protein
MTAIRNPQSAIPNASDGVRHYRFLAMLGLGILFVLLWQLEAANPILAQVQFFLSLALPAGGAIALFARRPIGPLLVLMPLSACLFLSREADGGDHGLEPLDLALCMTALAYSASHYRLLALRCPAGAAPARSQRPVEPGELIGLLVQLPLCTAAAEGVWYFVARQQVLESEYRRWMQFLTLTWLTAFGLFAARLAFRYWRSRSMDATVAQLVLQDVLWQETRGEQRRLNRWLAWRKVTRDEG